MDRSILRLVTAAVFIIIAMAVLSCPVAAGFIRTTHAHYQTSNVGSTTRKFEVAALKPDSTKRSQRISATNGTLTIESTALGPMLAYAYSVPLDLIKGGPNWFNTERYAVIAKSEPSNISVDEIKLMLQSLLADRFKLMLHTETRQLPVYSLNVSEKGPRLNKASQDEEAQVLPGTPSQGKGQEVLLKFSFRGQSMSAFVGFLQILLRPYLTQDGGQVVDKTGLTGRFDFSLEFAAVNPLQAPNPDHATAPDLSAPDIFEAVQEQLGLKLDMKKGDVEVVVIDHAEKPLLD